ncbi:MAG: phage holin family protein [Patescibacteria group bacterium]
MKLVVHLVVGTFAALIAAAIIPGVHIDNWVTALMVAVVLGVLNVLLKPILIILTLPITILTLGLFTFVINTLLVMLADSLIVGFSVSGFWRAFLFSLVFFILNSVMYRWAREGQ